MRWYRTGIHLHARLNYLPHHVSLDLVLNIFRSSSFNFMHPFPSSIFVVYVINAIIWTYAPRPLFQLGVGFGISLPCILGSRLLLNLRGAYRGRRQFTATDLLLRSSRWDHLFHGNESGTVLQPESEPELEQEHYSDDNNNMQEVDHHHDRDDDHDRPLAGQSCYPCPSRLSQESGICEGMGIAV